MICKNIKLYEDREDVSLTTYILEDSVEMLNGEKRGAVLICPGGAYLYCSDREGEPVAMAFSAMGYQTFVLRYSVYNENKGKNTMNNIMSDPNEPWHEKEFVRHPQPMRDIGKAMYCIRKHAGEWLVNTDQIALCGFSAGAHNCGMYSVYYDKPVITDYLGIGGEGLKPAAVVLGYMLSDYCDVTENAASGDALFEACIKAYLGGIPAEDKSFLKQVSPFRLVNENTPPMFLWATAGDNLVNPGHTLKMAAALNDHSISYEVHIFEEGNHGLCLGTQATASVKTQLDENVANWIHLADKWLKKRMAFDLPDDQYTFIA